MSSTESKFGELLTPVPRDELDFLASDVCSFDVEARLGRAGEYNLQNS
jgi:hypothetical protein